jgi:hypothetical protein
MLGVHESTISRKLDKLEKALRKQILAALRRRGMSRRQAEEALEIDVRDLQLDIRCRLAQEPLPTADVAIASSPASTSRWQCSGFSRAWVAAAPVGNHLRVWHCVVEKLRTSCGSCEGCMH